MSNNNASPEGTGGILIITGLVIMAVVLFYVALIFCIVLTLICIWAWNEERELFGQKITPGEARAFVVCGIVGATVLGILGLIIAHDNPAMKENLGYFGYGGYILGSLGGAALHEKGRERLEQQAAQRRILNALQHRAQEERPHQANLRQSANSFEYASWDDEEPRA